MSSYTSRHRDYDYTSRYSSADYAKGDLRRDRSDAGNREGHGKRSSDEHEARIKNRHFGAAFIGPEKDKYLREQLRGQLASSQGSVTPNNAGASSGPTPRMVVEEMKRSGHFDQLRKQILATFQASSHKADLSSELQEFLLNHLKELPSDKRQRLARQDARLQHSDLERVLEEDAKVGKIFDSLLDALRGASSQSQAEEGGQAESRDTDDNSATTPTLLGRSRLFSANDGALLSSLDLRLRETVDAERQRVAAAAAANSSSSLDATGMHRSASQETPTAPSVHANVTTATPSGESDAGSSTPHVKSMSGTPLRREVPREPDETG